MALSHYQNYMVSCTYEERYGNSCDAEVRKKYAVAFTSIDQTQRTRTVKAILCALSAPKSLTNEELRAYQKQQRKRRNWRTQRKVQPCIYYSDSACVNLRFVVS